jgi:tetratricopeptide (TPR) repeat protein
LLGLPTEWAVEVLGLEVPAELSDTAGRSEDHAALQLFRQSACRVAIDFRLSEENLSDVVRICRRVSGLPLGIELAAAWVRLFPCYQIADEMEQSLDFLQDPDGRATDRHQSLRATFDYSYNLLSETQRAHFRMLSVFRGGFTAGAAQQVCGTDPASLVCLVDRSLLQLSPSRRLDMHPILREYAVEKLAENPVEETATRDQHSRFYLSFIQERERSLKGDCAQDTQHEIYGELGNIREAWRWAVTREEIEDLRSSLAALSRFYDLRGLIREAQTVFAEAGERLLSVAVVVPQRRSLACRLLAEQALFLLHGADYARAMAVAEEAAAHACAIGESLCEATGHYVRGEALWRQGDYLASRTELEQALDGIREVQAMDGPTRPAREVETWVLGSLGAACWINGNREQGRAYLEQALDLAQADNNQWERSKLLTNLGVCQVEQGGYAEAIELFEQSLEIRQKVGDRRGEGITLGNLGNVCLYLGDYAQAKANYERALHIQREISARNDEALSRGNLGLVYHYLGENATARVLCDQGLRIARDTGEQRTVAALCMKLAHALTGLGQFDKAAAAYQESVALRRRQGWANVMMEPLAGLAGVRLAQGDVDRALAHAEEIWDCLQTGSLEGTISPFQVYWTCYRVLDAAQDTRSADCLAEAYRLLQERAGRIANEEMRRSFLQNVQPHREITREYVGLNESPQM